MHFGDPRRLASEHLTSVTAWPETDGWVAANRSLIVLADPDSSDDSTSVAGPPGRPLGSPLVEGTLVEVGLERYDLLAREWLDTPGSGDLLDRGLEDRPPGQFEMSLAVPMSRSHVLVAATYRPPRGAGASDPWEGPSHRLLVVDPAAGELVEVVHQATDLDQPGALAVAPNWIAAGGDGVRLWRLPAYEPVAGPRLRGMARGLARSNDGSTVVAVSVTGQAVSVEAETGEVRATWDAHPGDVRAVTVSVDDRVITGGNEGSVRVWSPGGELLGELDLGAPVESVAVSADGGSLAVCIGGPDPRLVATTFS